MFKFSWIFEPKFRWFLDGFLDWKRKHRFCKNSDPACTGARFLRFRGIWNQQKIKKSMQNKSEKWYMSSPADFQKNEKSPKICLKTPVKSSCIFNANFNDFCLHFGSQNPSQKWGALHIFSTFSPRHVQDAPRRFQDTSKMPLRPSKKPPRPPISVAILAQASAFWLRLPFTFVF